MQAGKQNNKVKRKLEELNEVPEGFAFFPSQSWPKLEAELTKKKKQKGYLWFYAAACLLLLSIAGFFYQPYAVSKTAGNSYTRKSSQKQLPFIKKAIRDSVVVDNKLFAAKKGKEAAVQQREKIPLPDKLHSHTNEVAETKLLKEAAVENRVIDSPAKLSLTVAPSTPKPKFKIAHINELYPPSTDVPLPPAPKNNIVFLGKKNTASDPYNEPARDENRVVQQKGKTFFSLFNTQ